MRDARLGPSLLARWVELDGWSDDALADGRCELPRTLRAQQLARSDDPARLSLPCRQSPADRDTVVLVEQHRGRIVAERARVELFGEAPELGRARDLFAVGHGEALIEEDVPALALADRKHRLHIYTLPPLANAGTATGAASGAPGA